MKTWWRGLLPTSRTEMALCATFLWIGSVTSSKNAFKLNRDKALTSRFKSSKERICSNTVILKDKTTKKWLVNGQATNRCRVRPFRNLWLPLCTAFRHQFFLWRCRTHESVIVQHRVHRLYPQIKQPRQLRPNSSSNNKFLASRIITQLPSAHKRPTRVRHQIIRWTSSFLATVVLVVSKPSLDHLRQRLILLSTSNHCSIQVQVVSQLRWGSTKKIRISHNEDSLKQSDSESPSDNSDF